MTRGERKSFNSYIPVVQEFSTTQSGNKTDSLSVATFKKHTKF